MLAQECAWSKLRAVREGIACFAHFANNFKNSPDQ